MPSPLVEISNAGGAYATAVGGVNVTPGATVVIRLISQAGVDTWSCVCENTDDLSVAATVNAGAVVDSVNKTVTLTAPVAGRAYLFRSKVNNGLSNGRADSTLETTFAIYTTINGFRVAAVNETVEGGTFGWIAGYNAIVRSGGSGVADAAAATKGIVMLAGDLNGTGSAAATPRVGGVTGVAGVLARTATTTLDTGDSKMNDRDVIPASIQTTNATVTNLYTFATTTSRIYLLRGIVTCQSSSAAAYGMWSIEAFFENNAGVLTQRLSSPVNTVVESSASMDVTVDVSGTSLRVRVTGLAGTNLRWTGRLYLHEGLF